MRQIGKMSSLVLCLCGIPKTIMLVCASMIFWGTPVTLLQAVGFLIASIGLAVYACLPADRVARAPHSSPSVEEIDEEKEAGLEESKPMMTVAEEESY